MIRLTALLLAPEAGARLRARYQDYRHHKASWLGATMGCLWVALAWIFIPLEHPRWQRIRANHDLLYPHINSHRPRPLDPLRYLLQSLWLVVTRPAG